MSTGWKTPRNEVRSATILIVALGGVLPVLIAIIGSLFMYSWRDDLPDPLAIHWGFDGPDGFASLAANIAILIAFVVIFSGLITTFTVIAFRRGVGMLTVRFGVGLSVWLGAFMTGIVLGSTAIQQGVEDASTTDAAPLAWIIPVAIVASLGLGFLAGWLLPATSPVPQPIVEPGPSIDLGKDERAVWTRRVSSPIGVLLVPVIILTMLVVFSIIWIQSIWISLIIGLVVVGAMTTLSWRVTIDRRGFGVRALLGWPRFHVPVDEITSAAATKVSAMKQFGGWGVRVGAEGRTGIIVRSGKAVEVRRRDKGPFVVTIDDAGTAAALLNGLVKQRRKK